LVVEQVVDAAEFLFDGRGDRFGGGAGIARVTPARSARAARSLPRASFLVSSRKISTTDFGSARSRASTA